MDVPMELSKVLITELGDRQAIVLREKDGQRSFPIMIGILEARAIRQRIHEPDFIRPLTHDLLGNMMSALGGRLEKIVINDMRRLHPSDNTQTFIATLYVRQGDRLIEVDSRPSDAIALGVGFDTPIFVAEEVLTEVLREPTSQERAEMLRQGMSILTHQIDELQGRLGDETFLAHAPPAVIEEVRTKLTEMKNEYDAIDQVLKKFG